MLNQTLNAMEERLMDIIGEGPANVIVQVKAEDLMRFAEAIYERAQTDALELLAKRDENEMITKRDTKALLGGISDATLWRWERDGYLIPERVGRKIMYRKRDIQELLSSH